MNLRNVHDRVLRRPKFWVLAVLIVSVLSLCGNPVSAERILLGRLPGKPAKFGFTMSVEMDAVSGNGYQPVYLTFAPLKASFPADRNFEVVIGPRNDWRTELDFDFRQAITVPQGSKKFVATVYVPYYYGWDSVRVSLLEDGKALESKPRSLTVSSMRTRYSEQMIAIGIIEPQDMSVQDAPWKTYPDVRTLVTVFGGGPLPEDTATRRLAHQAALKNAKEVQPAWVQFRQIEESSLHRTWLGYSQLDAIIVASPTLERIESEQPEALMEIKRWVAAGGSLWVYAVGDLNNQQASWLRADSVASGRVVTPKAISKELALNQKNDRSELVYQSWQGVQKRSQQYGADNTQSGRKEIYEKLKADEHPAVQTQTVTELAGSLRKASYGLGTVVMMKAEDPFPGSFQFWKTIGNLHDDTPLNWVERNGIDVAAGNDTYWGWLIRSVGQPPVKSFVLLNTLFAILVGPICYVFFRRRGRLYMLYFFAPCLALLVTLSLFAYALAADGIKTKMRCRQITWVDSKHEFLVDQSRQTYYAVLGSGRGVTLTSETAVFPVRHTHAINYYSYGGAQSAARANYVRRGSSQTLDGTFLPPRNQVQYLTLRPEPASQTIEFSFGENPSVTSRLPWDLKRLVVCDSKGSHWQADNLKAGNLKAGNLVALKPSKPTVVADMLGEKVLPSLGEVPMLQKNQITWGTGGGPGSHASRLEQQLASWSKLLPKNSFVAIGDAVESQFGVENPVVLDSVHVVMGELP